jgi:hypothetical protein
MKNKIEIIALVIFFLLSVELHTGQQYIWKIVKNIGGYVSESELYINNCKCIGVDTCLVLCAPFANGGIVLKRTTNGGQSWNTVYTDTNLAIEDRFVQRDGEWHEIRYFLSSVSKKLSYVIGRPARIIKSTDAGETWEVTKTHEDSCNFIYMTNQELGTKFSYDFLVYPDFILEITTDGGNTWKQLEIPEKYSPENGYYQDGYKLFNENLLIIKFKNDDPTKRVFVKVIDNFTKWTEYPVGIDNLSANHTILDSTHAWLCGTSIEGDNYNKLHRQIVYRSTDGLRSWEKLRDTIDTNAYAFTRLLFYDKQNGLATGPFFTLYRTTDGGVTWLRDSLEQYSKQNQGDETLNFIITAWPKLNTTYAINTLPVDFLLKCTLEGSVTVEENDQEAIKDKIVISPNPIDSNSLINITINEATSDKLSIYVYDILGKLIAKKENSFEETTQINSPHIPGVYYLKIHVGKEIFSGKILVM